MRSKNLSVTLPELALVAATRGMLGAGIGLLLADKFKRKQRKTLGWILFSIGAASTIPILADVLGKTARQQ